MRKEELKTIEILTEKLIKMSESFSTFKLECETKLKEIGGAVANKPANLEAEVLRAAQKAIAESIQGQFSGYGNPLAKLINSVVEENSVYLRAIISDSFNQAIKTEDFKNSIVSAFSHKISRSIISNQEGLFDKVSQELKQDSTFRAKITLAVANVVEECLKNK